MGEKKCLGCSECCRILKISVVLDEIMKEWFTAHFNRSINQVSFRIKHNCAQLTPEGKCAIYGNHPKICKDHYCNRTEQELLELYVPATELDL